jgi:catechol 2,3-dioxygenase-like lactoylglutathione lyase family enzyme
MIGNASIAPTIPVSDLARARKFYEEKLGLKPLKTRETGVLYDCGNGTSLFLYVGQVNKSDHVVAAFEVKDIEREIEDLKNKGVILELCDFSKCNDVGKVATFGEKKAMWFKDSEGNVLAVIQVGMLVELEQALFPFFGRP